jgi:hypothetical protein
MFKGSLSWPGTPHMLTDMIEDFFSDQRLVLDYDIFFKSNFLLILVLSVILIVLSVISRLDQIQLSIIISFINVSLNIGLLVPGREGERIRGKNWMEELVSCMCKDIHNWG